MMKLNHYDLIKHIPLTHRLYLAGASFNFIVNKIIKIDSYLANFKPENLYRSLNLVYNKFKNDTLLKKYSNLVVLIIPENNIDSYVEKYFYNVGSFYIALKSTITYYEKYVLAKSQFNNLPSETIIDKLYCKRLMRWFEIDDNFIITQAEKTVKDFSFSKKLYHEELEHIDTYYLKYYNTINNSLLDKL